MLQSETTYERIMNGMSEGVLTINKAGKITSCNAAALTTLGLEENQLLGRTFMVCFVDRPENDEFVQAFLDAIYDSSISHDRIVHYYKGDEIRHLRLLTSFLNNEGEKEIIAVFEDLSSLFELQDALKAMKEIEALNRKLNGRNKLLEKTFGRYLSDEIVNELIKSPDALEMGGKKRLITVLMSDLRGFTALCEHIDAEILILMLNHYLGEMIELIEKFGGTLIEIEGDGILAVFGALGNDPDHAEHAVAAALSMQSRLPAINAWNEERGYPSLQMGIGINSGDVVVGNFGSEKRTRFNVIGSSVNLCGRIESYTVDGQVLISPYTKALIKAPLTISGTLAVNPKGVENTIELYQITAIGAPYDVVGREEETELSYLEVPIPICFFKLDGKHVSDQPCFGGITAVAQNGALLSTESALSVYDNVRINAGGKLLGKVIEEKDGGFLVRYTSIPVGYASWIERNSKTT